MAFTREQPSPLDTARSAVTGNSRRSGLKTLARVGLVARGVVYAVIGLLSLELALGVGGKTTSQTGALKTIAHQSSFGEFLLVALAIGFAAYAILRAVEGFGGSRPNDKGAGQRRVAALGSAVIYAALCATAIEILAGSKQSGASPKHAAAGILGWPGGPLIVGIVGLAVVAAGLYQVYKGLSRKFLEDSDCAGMSEQGRKMFSALGVTGFTARAVIMLLVGYGLIKAAVDYSAKSAVGLDGALQKLAHGTAGPLLLGLVAAGFIAFALYSIVDARYHRV
jgi:uncharacterized membrane protein (DUF2068 family)